MTNMTKTKSYLFKMAYIEAQDKKLKFGIKTNELQAGWLDGSKDRLNRSKIAYQQT